MTKKLDSIELDLDLLFLKVKGTWKPNDSEKKAAWELVVELVTRISVIELKENDGILREALNSIYSLFSTTREVLRTYGPSVAVSHEDANYSLGKLAVNMLNFELRPLLAKWHPLLQEYESRKEENVSVKAHEDKWENGKELRKELNKARIVLIDYSKFLAKAAGVEPLLDDEQIK